MRLAELLGDGHPKRVEIAAHLDSLDAAGRVAECAVLSKEQLKRLWQAAASDPAEVQELVGERNAVFAGRNSLSLFNRFEKCFARHGDAIVGFNRTSLAWLIGPGYFTVTATPSGLLFDYGRAPVEAPDGWPRVTSNTRLFARSVYGGLLDDAVWAARDVLIGSARRGDSSLDSYFVLARA